MAKWEKESVKIGEMEIYVGMNEYRIKFEGKYFYISRTKDMTVAYNDKVEKVFQDKINEIKSKGLNRKEQRRENKYYKKMLNKINKGKQIKPNIIQAKPLEVTDNVEKPIDEVKKETAENLIESINKNEESDNE